MRVKTVIIEDEVLTCSCSMLPTSVQCVRWALALAVNDERSGKMQ
jgi:hypothetical protein